MGIHVFIQQACGGRAAAFRATHFIFVALHKAGLRASVGALSAGIDAVLFGVNKY